VGLTIGVDVGGTKIAAGVVDDRGQIRRKVRISTPATTAESVEDGIVQAVLELVALERGAGHQVAAVGVAAPGFVDAQRSTLRFTPNLPMADRPLRATLGPRIGLPVVVENDASAAAWGEFRFGGGRGVSDVVLLTVGTGLGGGVVLDGRLLRGAFGIAGEFGHVRIVPGGLPCGCGNRGCWEQYVSGRALIRQARELARVDRERAARMLDLAGGDPQEIAGAMVTQAAWEADLAAGELLAELGRWLGEGIADIANVLDPAAVVIGGGVSEAGDLLLEPARKAFGETLSAGAHRPHLAIRAAELGIDAGLIGVADLARQP
jgi:glucokinase